MSSLPTVHRLQQQGKQNRTHFKAMRNIQNKLEDCAQRRAHYATALKSRKLLPV